MEHQTRFDLKQAVDKWRQELAARPAISGEDARELESHLHESVSNYVDIGLNQEDAFWLARRKLGSPDSLSEEFQKAAPRNVWRNSAFWVVFGVALSTLWSVLFGLLGSIASVVIGSKYAGGAQWAGTISGALGSVSLALLILALSRGHLIGPISSMLTNKFGWFFGGWVVLHGSMMSFFAYSMTGYAQSAWIFMWPILVRQLASGIVIATIFYCLMPSRQKRTAFG